MLASLRQVVVENYDSVAEPGSFGRSRFECLAPAWMIKFLNLFFNEF